MSAQSKKDKKKEIRKIKRQCQKYKVFLNCGCCYEILHFLSEKLIEKQFISQGLVINAKITDSIGYSTDKIDTFYGYEVM